MGYISCGVGFCVALFFLFIDILKLGVLLFLFAALLFTLPTICIACVCVCVCMLMKKWIISTMEISPCWKRILHAHLQTNETWFYFVGQDSFAHTQKKNQLFKWKLAVSIPHKGFYNSHWSLNKFNVNKNHTSVIGRD